jgi:hypothetical protein
MGKGTLESIFSVLTMTNLASLRLGVSHPFTQNGFERKWVRRMEWQDN